MFIIQEELMSKLENNQINNENNDYMPNKSDIIKEEEDEYTDRSQ